MTSFELKNPPSDGISRVRFSPDDSYLLVSSWDSTVRVYDAKGNTQREKYKHKAAVLDCSWVNDNEVVSGSLDKTIQCYDRTRNLSNQVGQHNDAVRCVEHVQEKNLVLSGSWDKTIKLWDIRTLGAQGGFDLPNKVFAVGVHANTVVVGTAGRHVEIFDLRTNTRIDSRESVLKYQTRCIKIFPEGDGYALSSTEGRVAMEYFDHSPDVQQLKYAFKCHRSSREQPGQGRIDVVYPVNVIEFHPTYGTFATGGGDGRVNIWDGKNKKRICQFPPFSTSISSLAFNSTGDQLAVAVSYTYEEGDKEHDPDAIWIRSMADEEVRPKSKTDV